MSKVSDALAWMLADRSRGYKKAAKEFGVEVSELKRARAATRSVEKSQTKTGQISRAEFDAWRAVSPLATSVTECLQDLRPNENHTKTDGTGEYDRIWRFMKSAPAAASEKVEPVDPTEKRRTWAIERLSLVEADLANLRNRDNPSANGLAALQKSAREYRDIIDSDAAPVEDGWNSMSHSERLEAIEEEVSGWPPEYLEVALRVFAEQVRGDVSIKGGSAFLVHEGGRAVLTEEGWEQVDDEAL